MKRFEVYLIVGLGLGVILWPRNNHGQSTVSGKEKPTRGRHTTPIVKKWLTQEEITKLECPNAQLYDWYGSHSITGDLYNGSTVDVAEVIVRITVFEGESKDPIIDRDYSLMAVCKPLEARSITCHLGFTLKKGQTFKFQLKRACQWIEGPTL